MAALNFDVVVIGGGAAGMMAACIAAESGKSVAILEKNGRLGKKLSITGGGRCNITNAEFDNRQLLSFYGQAANYLHSPFSQFSVKDSFDFFETKGLQLKTEARQRVFPVSDQAEDVVRLLEDGLRLTGVQAYLKTEVYDIAQQNGRIVSIATNRGQFVAKSYILATGGMSRPETGSTGDGFGWLTALGHTVRQPSPSIVPIAVKDGWVKGMAGKTVEARIVFLLDNQRQFKAEGRILFTHFGLSGPTILNNAARIGELLQAGEVTAHLDLFPSLDHGACDKQLMSLIELSKNKELKTILKDWLPAGMGQVVGLLLPDLDLSLKVHSLPKDQRKQIVQLIKALPITVSHLLGFDKAVVADGGVALTEIDTKTMRSKVVSNLYVVGDLLDINRPSGGYSLQLCWTTGYVAGRSC